MYLNDFWTVPSWFHSWEVMRQHEADLLLFTNMESVVEPF